MKVVHLISGGDIGGAKTHVLSLIEGLNKEQGIDAKLLCVMEGDFVKEAKERSIPVKVIVQRMRYDFKAIKKMAAYIKAEEFDIIHCHGARANFISLFLRLFVKKPMITTMHSDYKLDFQNSRYKQFFYMPVNAFALHRIKFIIAITENFKKMLTSRRFKPENIFVVYNGLDFDEQVPIKSKDEFLSSYEIDVSNNLLIGIASRFHPVKGVDLFLKAAKEFLDRNKDSNVTFLLAGSGQLMDSYKQYVQNNDLSRHIRFLGYVEDVYSFLGAIDINVLSSYSESFPYSLLEGAKMQKATISSDAGGIPEMIEHESSGLLFPVGDYNKLAESMEILVNDRELRNRLGERFYERARDKFSLKNLVLSHKKIYTTILKEQKK